MKSRILICGGREFKDQALFDKTMLEIKPWIADYFCVIQGGARGADRMAQLWAFFQGCAMIAMPANWDYYDKKAGPVRNKWMLDFGLPDLIVALPGNSGTANMVKQARERNIDVYEVKYFNLPGIS